MMRCAIAVLTCLVFLSRTTQGSAATPSPTPAATLATNSTPTTTPAHLDLNFSQAAFSWSAVVGAMEYRLTGTVFVVRANAADPFCTAPIAPDGRSIAIDATLPAEQTSYLVLPPLPGVDIWIASTVRAEIQALDLHGAAIASGAVGLVSETQCALPSSTIRLPETGRNGANSRRAGLTLAAVGLAIFGGFVGIGSVAMRQTRG